MSDCMIPGKVYEIRRIEPGTCTGTDHALVFTIEPARKRAEEALKEVLRGRDPDQFCWTVDPKHVWPDGAWVVVEATQPAYNEYGEVSP